MKKILLLFPSLLFLVPLYSQQKEKTGKNKTGFDIRASLGAQLPFGDFSSTHILGISTDFSPSAIVRKLPDGKRKDHLAFTYNGGLTYYFGKKETVSGYSYTYPGYFLIHAFAGMMYIHSAKLTTALLAGPALGIYNGNTRFTIGSRLESSYLIKRNISAGPLLNFMLEPGTNALWSAGIKITFNL